MDRLNGVPAHARITRPINEEITMATLVTVSGVDFTGDPCRIVTGTFNGRYLRAGERVWAALFAFQWWLDKRHPDLYLYIIQSAYHEGWAPSAGTHDKDRVLDVLVINRKTGRRVWLPARKWLRMFGWAAWWRHTGSWILPSNWHIHMALLGGSCPVGYLVPGQIRDYYQHRTGLSGHLLEPGWYPPDIDATVFDYPAWIRTQQEEQMEYKDWSAESKKALAADVARAITGVVADAILDAPLNTKTDGEAAFRGVTLREGLKRVVRPLLGKSGGK